MDSLFIVYLLENFKAKMETYIFFLKTFVFFMV